MKNSGIYCISNTIDSRIYIGSSVRLNTRIGTHKLQLRKGVHHNPKMQCFVNKYGVDALKFFILHHCNHLDLLSWEQMFINLFKPEFNVSLKAGSPMFGRNHTEDARKRMSEYRKGKPLGPLSEEHRRKIGLISSMRRHSDKSKAQTAASMARGKCYCAKLVINTQNGIFYYCAIDAAESIGMNAYTLRNRLNGSKANNSRFLYV